MTTFLRNDLNTHNIYKPLKPNTTTNRFQRTDQESCFHREKRDPPPENPTGPPPEKRVTFSEREERPHQTNPTSRFQRERRETPPVAVTSRRKPHQSLKKIICRFVGMIFSSFAEIG